MWHKWGKRGMHIGYWWDSQKKSDYMENQTAGGWTILRWIYCILASCYIRLTLNICSFVRQCNKWMCYIDGQKNKYSVLRWIIEKQDGVVWSGLIWLRTRICGGLLWTQRRTFGFHKMLRISWVVAQMVASIEVLHYLALVGQLIWWFHSSELKLKKNKYFSSSNAKLHLFSSHCSIYYDI
jgi:hypothetical protein